MKALTYIFVFAVLIRIGVNTKDKSEIKQCLTARNSPQNPNTPCILPFKLKGQWKNECLPHSFTWHKDIQNYWCPTKVNQDHEHFIHEKHWGFCSKSCPLMNKTKVGIITLGTTKSKQTANLVNKHLTIFFSKIHYFILSIFRKMKT